MTEANSSVDPGAQPGWRWDVALSFAGAQRDYVGQVAQALKSRGVRCFYDADEEIDLWGKYLAEELPAIYGEQAAAVVIFVSAEYAARDWTLHERRAALGRAVRERREYVLPARFDDTPLPGLLPDLSYVDLRGRTPQQFAAMIAAKLANLDISPSSPGEAGRRPPGGIPVSEADPSGRPQVIRLLDDAIHAALSVPGEKRKAAALAHVASAMAAFDPDRAAQLINRAEHLIPPTDDNWGRGDEALAGIITALVAIDLGRAEHLIQPTADETLGRDLALAGIATALVTIDLGRVEQLALSITHDYYRAGPLTEVAIAVAAADPDLAVRIAQSVAPDGGSRRDEALAAVAAALAVTDPDRAERIAQSVAPDGGSRRDEALAAVAAAFTVTDPDRAERIARSITFELWAAEALGAVAEAVRVSDPVRSRGLAVEAEGIARSFANSSEKGKAYARFAKALAATDPYKARSHAEFIMGAPSKAAEVLAEVAKVLAATDPDEAENVAHSIFDHHWKIMALTEVAKVLAATDPDRAERLAYAITDEVWLPQALAGIAVVLANG